jgi:hypothetical protein
MLCPLVILRDPPGSAIRPMDVPLYELAIAFGAAFLGLPLARAAWNERRRLGALAAFVLCLSPFFVSQCSFFILVESFDYSLKP